MSDHHRLPYVDEHATTVEAGPDRVWDALTTVLDRTFSRRGAAAYARAVGCVPADASGARPLTVGSTVPGFAVMAAEPGRELVIEGRHHFSTYALVLRLEPDGPGRTSLRGETRAAFPGLAGGAYRLLVIGSRGHVVGMRRLLTAVRRKAEAGAA